MNVLLPFPLAYHPLYPLDLLAEYLFLEQWSCLVSVTCSETAWHSPFAPWRSLIPPTPHLFVSQPHSLHLLCLLPLSFLIYLGFISPNL